MGRVFSIRQNLILNLILIIALLSGTIIMITTVAARSAIEELSRKIIEQSIDQTEKKLSGFFNPVEKELLAVMSLGENQIVTVDEPEKLWLQFKSIMQLYPQLSAVYLADDSGRNFMLLRTGRTWLSRQLTGNNQAKIIQWDEKNRPIDEKTIRSDYDPRTRPWFKNATKRWDEFDRSDPEADRSSLLSWTDPYLFYTIKKPGLTASVRYRTIDGQEFVLGFDILLEDIQEFAQGLKILNQGQFVIATLEDVARIVTVSLKDYPGEPGDSITKPLTPVQEIETPLIRNTIQALWNRPEDKMDTPVRFSNEKQMWWGASKRFSIAPDEKLMICVVVPESDLLGDIEKARVWILVITVVVLAMGVMRVVFIANRYSRPIESLVASSKRISRGDFNPGPPIFSRSIEVLKLAEAHERMRNSLKTLMKMEDDIKIARDIQQNTFPSVLPKIQGFEIAGWNTPADETGGDIYDVIGYKIDPENNTIAIDTDEVQNAVLLLGDAAGHGVGPALSVTQIRAMLRIGVRINPDLSLLINHINQQLYTDLSDGRFISAWFGQISGGHLLNYFSAGQAPLIHYCAKTGKADILKADTFPLGITDEPAFKTINSIEMRPGDIFAVMSDGIFEAVDNQKEMFGTDRIITLLLQMRNRHPEKIIDAIRREVDRFTQKASADDDRTILIIKRV